MLMRTDPFRELDRLAEAVLGTPTRPAAMPIDAYRKGDTFVVQYDMPGVSADSIDLTVERNELTVHATRNRTNEGHEMLVAERPYGTFSRRLFLGEALDVDNIDASYTDGVLTLTIPIAEAAKPRKIDVRSDSNTVTVSSNEKTAISA